MANVNASLSHSFAVVPPPEVPRSQFDRSHWHKTTFDSGYLFPIYVDLAYPGDTFNMNIDAFARVATPLVPIMDDLWIETFSFAVPIRLLWSNFKRFMGETTNPGDSVDFLVPQVHYDIANPTALQSLGDYFGFPVGQATDYYVSALPFRAYNLIWKEWFRAEFIQDSPVINTGDGPDSPANYPLRRRGKRHDYFTSCAPWPQNTTDVPIGIHAPVTTGSVDVGVNGIAQKYVDVLTGNPAAGVLSTTASGFLQTQAGASTPVAGLQPSNLELDFTMGTSETVNAIREAFQIQRMLEREARTGTRYTEIIRGSFGVLSDDARQQRPEYLGGGSSPVNFHPVAQTSGSPITDGYTTTPQGNLAAFGTASVQGHGWTKSFTEHCVVMTLACVRGPLHY